ncbi:MAG: type VI secretion system tip protein VgrG [Enterobacter ludwigii]|nr:type VI secretion system tip protein VgrG [Enterobacter ludwigii]
MSEILTGLADRAVQTLISQSRYRLDVHECPHFLDVLSFRAEESLSAPWHYHIRVTRGGADIACDALLLKFASFTFQVPDFNGRVATPLRTLHGVVQSFRRLSTSADETTYQLTLVPRIALLQLTRQSAIYQNVTVPELVEQILRSHGLEGPDFAFHLARDYPVRELITQWQETDLAFVQRILAEVGIFWRTEMDEKRQMDVVIFQDTQAQYLFGTRIPLRSPSGTSDNGQASIWAIRTSHQVVSNRVTTRDYNYRQAKIPQDSTESLSGEDSITTGVVYHYAEPFLSAGDTDTPEAGAFYARLRHERLLNAQHQVTGRSTSPQLLPGQVLESDVSLPESLKEGMVITRIRSRGSRRSSFILDFDAIPYSETVCFRPPLVARPVVAGTLVARVESETTGDSYAWLDLQGRYRVRLNVDRSDSGAGEAYLWLRLAKPYAGYEYGWHAPLLDGTEVAVAFDAGDPDRPYIAHAFHDSEHPDPVTQDNHTRNVLRTPSNNKLRLEDQQAQEHIKLATEYGKSQLNMGHLVNAERQPRGTGFELRTDEYGALRAARGLFLSADEQPKAQGQVLEMSAAVGQITQANNEMQALHDAAQAAQALTCDIRAQRALLDERLKQLQSAVLLASAPRGVAFTSGENVQLTASQNVMVNAGQHLDLGAMKNVSVAAEASLGLFAHKDGMKLIAGQGDIAIQAQHNTMALSAEKQVTITSTDDEIIISTPKTLTLNGGGSYLKLSENGIEHGSEGKMIMKVAEYLVLGSGASLSADTSEFGVSTLTEVKHIDSKSFHD